MKKKHCVSWLIKKSRRRIPALLLLIVLRIAGALLGVAFALGTRQVIDCAVSGASDALRQAVISLGAVIVLMLACIAAGRELKVRMSMELERDWRRQLLHGLLEGEYALVRKYHSGELMNRLNNDVRAVSDGMCSVAPDFAAMVTRLLAAMAALSILTPKFTLWMVLVGLLVALCTGALRRYMKNLHKRVNEANGRVFGLMQEALEKILMVQAMDVAPEMERRADVRMAEQYALQKKQKNASVGANMAVTVLTQGVGFFALVWCAQGLLTGAISFGTLTAVTQLVSQLRTPFVNMSGFMPRYYAMLASAERLMELDEIAPRKLMQAPEAQKLYEKLGGIGAQDLCFAYEQEEVLHNVSFCLPKGSITAVVGSSGIGKSTLLKLMLGVFEPVSGSLYLQTADKNLPLHGTYSGLFSYVPQGNLLLSGTVRDNLLLIRPEATQEELDRAVYISAMDEFLPQLPQGLDTELGENGTGLSEGQAQRLAIARAVLSTAPIILLDEATSALDEQTERIVLERISALRERTCIVVTHRPAAQQICTHKLQIDAEGAALFEQEKASENKPRVT